MNDLTLDNKLKNIWINDLLINSYQTLEIRIEWNNGRNQLVKLDDKSPKEIIKGLKRAAELLEQDFLNGYL